MGNLVPRIYAPLEKAVTNIGITNVGIQFQYKISIWFKELMKNSISFIE